MLFLLSFITFLIILEQQKVPEQYIGVVNKIETSQNPSHTQQPLSPYDTNFVKIQHFFCSFLVIICCLAVTLSV